MAEDELENTPETFQRLINETNEWKDKYLRIAAETENTRKRIDRDKQTAVKFANESFARDLLDTLDSFEKALSVEMDKSVREGITLIYQNLQTALYKNGVNECPLGTFDPAFHEAVSSVSGGFPNKIVEVLRKGYMFGDRLLRPASVVISK